MENPTGESTDGVLRLDFDRKLTLQFRGSVVTSDAGLLAYRELDAALGLAVMVGEMLADARTGQNGRHALVGLSRQSVFGRLAEYEDVTTPSVCGMIPRCAGSSAAKRLRVVRPRRARWAASRRNGLRRKRTFRLLLISQADGSMPSMVAVRQKASCSTWIRASARRTANRR
jgi:hypothetical protein